MISEYGILGDRLARLDRLEKDIQVRAHVVPVVALVERIFANRFLADLRIMLRMPHLEVLFTHLRRETLRVVAGLGIDARLRRMAQLKFSGFEKAPGPQE